MSFNVDNQQKSLSGSASNLTLSELLQRIQDIPKLNISVKKVIQLDMKIVKNNLKWIMLLLSMILIMKLG